MTIQQAFALSLQHHQAGRLSEAEAIYRQILAVEPQHAGAVHYLGVIAHQVGRNDLAAELIARAIALRPHFPEAHSNLGNVLKALGKMEEAIASYRHAIALNPDYTDAHYNLGTALSDAGQFDLAIVSYRQAIALAPDYSEAHYNLGNALHEKGLMDEAIAAYRQAIAFKPDYSDAYNNLGVVLSKRGHLDSAIASYRHAILLRPDYPDAHCNLGEFLYDKGNLDEAIAACRRAIALKPDFPEAYCNLGNALKGKGQLEDAVAAYRTAIAQNPKHTQAHSNLGNAWKDKGQLDEAIAAYRDAIAVEPKSHEAHSNLVHTLHSHPGIDAEAIAEEHRRWGRRHAEPLARLIEPHPNGRIPERRLRVGYVSPDFRAHSVAFFVEDLLERHDPAQFEVFCYAGVTVPDAVTDRLRRHAAHWRSTIGMPDAEVAELIRRDTIDILVDLAGHTAHNRLLVFARKPAPVQVTWLGYLDSTGMAAMDYRLTDALADPPGTTEHLHTEQLVRLPDCAWCYRPSEHAPAVSSPPVSHKGYITFGCFNSQSKITTRHLKLWSSILLAVPGSSLLLKNTSLRDRTTQQALKTVFASLGIAPERIELIGYLPLMSDHLALYGRVDIALDTYPYHGTTTTCEALWMGVPVVSLAGKTHGSRVGVSLLSNVGLQELVAASDEQYVELATTLATDLTRVAQLRSTLRERMVASPLMDGSRFTRNVEQAYRQMWRRWCAESAKPTSP